MKQCKKARWKVRDETNWKSGGKVKCWENEGGKVIIFPPPQPRLYVSGCGGASNGIPPFIRSGFRSLWFDGSPVPSAFVSKSSWLPPAFVTWGTHFLDEVAGTQGGPADLALPRRSQDSHVCLSDILTYWKGLTDCFANSNSILAQGPSRLVEGWTCSPVERLAWVNNQPSRKPRSRVGAPWSPASSTLGCAWMLQRFW